MSAYFECRTCTADCQYKGAQEVARPQCRTCNNKAMKNTACHSYCRGNQDNTLSFPCYYRRSNQAIRAKTKVFITVKDIATQERLQGKFVNEGQLSRIMAILEE